MLVYGGYNGSYLSETWEWDGTRWTQKHPVHNPGARRLFGIAALPTAGHVLIFGGNNGNGSSFFGDTWEWDGTDWTQKSPTNLPPARWLCAMTYDSGNHQVVLFGGRTISGTFLGDTWVWDGTNWTQKNVSGPSGRTNSRMADELGGKVLLFGGYDAAANATNGEEGDTWEWNGTAWTRLATTGPHPRDGECLSQDANGKVLMFGGFDGVKAADPNSTTLDTNDTWEWSGTAWVQKTVDVPAGTTPPPRSFGGMAYNSTLGVVLFGGDEGDNSGDANDLWQWNGTAWVQPAANGASNPSTRTGHEMADEGSGKILMFGGYTGSYINETWEWNGSAWSQKSPGASPAGRRDFGMASEGNGKILIFGGQGSAGLLGDTWEWDGTTWSLKTTPAQLTARSGVAMAAEGGGKVLLFGGVDNSVNNSATNRNDTWEWNGTSWAVKSPAAPLPPGRGYHRLSDEAGGKVLLFGGEVSNTVSASGYINDTWEWDGTNWNQKTPASSPGGRALNGMAYDSIRQRVIIFGGQISGAYTNDTWEWTGTNWVQMNPATVPGVRTEVPMAFDSTLAKAVMFGGDSGNVFLNNTFDYYGAPPFINSISRADANPALSGTVHFTASFSEPVTLGASPSDFVVTTANLAGSSVAAVSVAGSAATITVNSGIYNGTERLDLVDHNSIRDLFGNPLLGLADDSFNGGQSYTIYTPPTANPQTVPVAFNTAASLALTGTDFNSPPETLTYNVTVSPTKGNVTGTAPNLTYTPGSGANGTDTLKFTVTNTDNHASSAATVTFNVAPGTPSVNGQSVSTGFNTARGITLTGSDPDTNPALALTYSVVNTPAHGGLSGAGANLTYTPAANYHGSDSFSFTASNGTNTSGTGVVLITVAAGTPAATPQSVNAAHNAGTGIALSATDPDVPALSLTYALGASPAHGSLSNFNAATGAVTYTPTADYHGADSFTFTANNGTNTSGTATIGLNVAVGTPTTNNQSLTTVSNTATNVTLTASDADTPALPLSYSIATGPSHGSLSGTPPNVVYTGSNGFAGADSFTFTANNGANTSTSGTVSLTVSSPVSHFTVGGAPANLTAGGSFQGSVVALDSSNQVVAFYNGSVHFTSSDGQAVLPANSTLTSGSGTFVFTLKTAGGQTVSANDVANPSASGTSGTVSVAAAGATHLSVGALVSSTAGAAFDVTVTALDPFGNTDPSYAGAVHFTKTDSGASAALPADYNFVAGNSGSKTFSGGATLVTAGNQTVTATDKATASITGSSIVNVKPATAVKLAFTTQPGSATAGAGFGVQPVVKAQDAFGNNSTAGLPGSLTLTMALSAGTGPLQGTSSGDIGTGAFTPGAAAFANLRIDNASDAKQLTASTAGLAPAASTPFKVSTAALAQFAVKAPTTGTAGSPFGFDVTAQDAYANTIAGYAGTVHFTSTDGSPTLPADSTLVSGTGSFSATLDTAGNQTLAAADKSNAAISGTSGGIAIVAAPATHFSVNAGVSAVAGSADPLAVSARDAFENIDANYAGTVHFGSTDAAATVPGDATLTSGTGGFSVTLRTAGSKTVTATDADHGSINGTSNGILVTAAPATHFAVSAPGSATAGAAFNVLVTALDLFNNTDTSYGGAAHFTSTDGAAVLPANPALVSGTGSFSATLKTAATTTITATDVLHAAISGSTGNILVGPSAPSQYTFAVPLTGTAGAAFSFAVTVRDQFGNATPGYAGMVHFTASDTSATLPADAALTSGSGTFAATMRTSGNQTLAGTDTVSPSITGTSANIGLGADVATHLALSAPALATAGKPFKATVIAKDQFQNIATGYGGTLHFSATDGAGVPPPDATLSGGTGDFGFTLKTAGTFTLAVVDTVNGSLTAQSGGIQVSPAAATHLAVTAPPTATVNVPFTFSVTAQDPFNNTDSSYAGTVHFTSTDGGTRPSLPTPR